MSSTFKTALVAAVVSAVVSAGAALATTQAFTLGTTNRVNAPSSVTNLQANGTTVNPVDAPLMTLENKSTTANATPLSLLAAPSHAPLRVNTQTKVANLNADQVDGRSSEYFLPKTAKAADSDKLDGLDSSAFLPATGTAANSSALGGQPPSYYQPVSGAVRDWQWVVSDGDTFPNGVQGVSGLVPVFCPSGKVPLGGGWSTSPYGDPDFQVMASAAETSFGSPDGWQVYVRNNGTSPITVYAWAMCARVS